MIEDKEIDKLVKQTLKPEITQQDSIDKSVDVHIAEMGFLWDIVQQTFSKDKTCFSCKKQFSPEDKTYIIQVSSKDKGVCIFCTVCGDCLKKLEEKKK